MIYIREKSKFNLSDLVFESMSFLVVIKSLFFNIFVVYLTVWLLLNNESLREPAVQTLQSLGLGSLFTNEKTDLPVVEQSVPELEQHNDEKLVDYKMVELSVDSRVLITGGAGFIGFSVARNLRKQHAAKIVVVDNFDPYYSTQLKSYRAEILQKSSVILVEGDVCDADLLRRLHQEHNFTHILHLAAQPGVRNSLQNPSAYLKNNVDGFFVLLDLLRSLKESNEPLPHFTYASSSSVYGLSKQTPFKENDQVDKQANFYGYSKRTNEQMAKMYFDLYGIPSVGLRLFTVYGPWGRPDMSPSIFTRLLVENKKITIFNDGKMQRDFTYIDDIVDGVLKSMQFVSQSAEIFNLGNNKPESVMKLLDLIEKRLNRKAQVEYKESKSEMEITVASIEKSKKILGFNPKTSLEEGVNKFLDWYLLYHNHSTYCISKCSSNEPNELPCIESTYDEAAELSKSLSEKCFLVLYTVMIHRDVKKLYEPSFDYEKNGTSCYFAFISESSLLSRENEGTMYGKWNLIRVKDTDLDVSSRKYSRIPKFAPDNFFSLKTIYAVYVDASIELHAPPLEFITYSEETNTLLTVFATQMSQMTLEEMMEKIDRRGKTSFRLIEQIKHYDAEAKKEQFGYAKVVDASIIVHNMNSRNRKKLRCRLQTEYESGSDLDKVIFSFVFSQLANENGHKTKADDQLIPIGANYKNEPEYVSIVPSIRHWKNNHELVALKLGNNDLF